MAYVHEGFWYDCGTPENYALVNAEVAEHWTHWSKVLHPAVLGPTQRPGKPPEMHQHSHDSLRRP
jgi:NDP-sugar pyrophosphorylase family protein